MNYILDKSWSDILKDRFSHEYKVELFGWLEHEYATKTIFPPKEKIFNALNLVPPQKVKVVIIGQDPYHVPGQADGLAFSCHNGTQQPSLRNIFKEISNEFNIPLPTKTDLTTWAEQGVLLLNTSLTVIEHLAASHSNELWHTFTTEIVKILNELNQPIVFMLWGNHAKSFLPLLNNPNHLVLTSAHPSPMSVKGFLGNGHFVKANNFLVAHNLPPIDWRC